MSLYTLVAVLRFTVSGYEADTSNACEPGPRLESALRVRLYRMACYQAQPQRILIRERPTLAGLDTLQVDNATCASYFVTLVDSAGNESCERGITVGIPSVGVPPSMPTQAVLYDIAGRRVQVPTRGGVYFTKGRRIVIWR